MGIKVISYDFDSQEFPRIKGVKVTNYAEKRAAQKAEIRTEQEVRQRIDELGTAWKKLIPARASETRDSFLGQLEALYWFLGYPWQKAIEAAQDVLGEDPLTRS